MELFLGFRKTFLSVGFLLFIGNVKAQVGDLTVDTAIGELPNPLLTMATQGTATAIQANAVQPAVDDLMIDTPAGKVPNPLLTMATQGTVPAGQANAVQPIVDDLMIDTPAGKVPNPLLTMATQGTVPAGQADAVQPTGGGFNVHRFPVLGTDANTMFPIDASRIAGVANGHTIYLPGILSNHFHSGSPVVLPAQTTSTSATDPNQQYVLKNEKFTALGNIGNSVRVPIPNISPADKSASSSGSRTSQPDGTITIDPKDIIGVADMNQVGADGNPTLYSFNPGSGHASELSALHSGLQGTAVDMSGLLPPPFESQSSTSNEFPPSSASTSTTYSTSSTNESTSLDLFIDTAPSTQRNAHSVSDTLGMNSVSALNNPSQQDKNMIRNQGSTFPGSNTQQGNTLPLNEISMYDAVSNTGDKMTNTQDHITFDSGVVTGSTGINVNSTLNTNEQTISATGVIPGGANLNEQQMANTNKQSMLGMGGISNGVHLNEQTKTNTNEQSTLGTGSNSGGMNSNEQLMTNTNERSMFGTGTISGSTTLNDKYRLKTNEQSLLGTGSGVSDNTSLHTQSRGNTNEQSMLDTGSVTGVRPNLNYQTMDRQIETNNVLTNTQSQLGKGSVSSGKTINNQLMSNTNEQSMFGTGSASSGTTLNEQSRTNRNEQTMFGTGTISGSTNLDGQSGLNTNEQSMFGTGRALGGTAFNDQSRTNTIEQSMLSTGTVSGSKNLNDQYTNKQSLGSGSVSVGTNVNKQSRTNKNEQSVLDTGTFGLTDSFTTGQGSKQSLSEHQSITSVNEPSLINTTGSKTNYIPNEWTGANIGIKENNIVGNNEQLKINTGMQQADIITSDQLNMNQKNHVINEPLNVDTNIGAREGLSNKGLTTVGGLFGVVERENNGSSGSRFSGLDNNINMGMETGGGEQAYAVAGNIATGTVDGTIDTSRVATQVDSVQQTNRGTASLLGVSDTKANTLLSNNEQLSLSLTNSVTTPDSSNTVSAQRANSLRDVTSQNVPHVSDLNTGGIYPFEGSLSAADATLTEGSSAVLDMNSVLQGKEPLHLEPSLNIVGEVVSGATVTEASGSNTGIYAVTGDTNAANINQQGATYVDTSTGRSVSSARDVSSNTNALTSTHRNPNEAFGVSFVSGGNKVNGLAIDKVNQYVGAENVNNKQPTFGENGTEMNLVDVYKMTKDKRVMSSSENTSQLKNSQKRLTEANQKITDASKLSNDHREGLTVAGNINNNINAINTLEASSHKVNNKSTTITDGVGVAMSGFSGAPITNMVGVKPGISRGGLTVKGINIPSYQITSRNEEFSSNSSNEVLGSMSSNSDIPVGSFVIGAGKPNSKIINTGIIGSLPAQNVGGVALGSGMSDSNPNIRGISLPQTAFKSDNRLNIERKQAKTEKTKSVKVDMSSFIPPPYEVPKKSSLNVLNQSTLRGGSTADVTRNAVFIDRQNRRDLLRNKELPYQGSAVAQPFNERINDRTTSSGGLSSRHGTGSTLRQGATSEITTNAALQERQHTIDLLRNQVGSNQGSVAVQQFNKHINDRTASSGGLSSRHGTGSTLREGATSEITTNAALQERQHTIDLLRNQVGSNQGSVAVQQFNKHINDRTASSGGLSSRHGTGSTLRQGATSEITTNAALQERQHTIDRLRNQGRSNQGSVAVQQLNKHINDGTASNGGLSSRHGTVSTLREGATSEIATNAALLERQHTIDRLRNQVGSNQGFVAVQQFNKHINDRTASSGGLSSRHGTGSTLRGATSEIATNAALLERKNTIEPLRNQVGSNQGSVAVQQFNKHINDRTASSGGLSNRHGTGSTLRQGATSEITTNAALQERQHTIDRLRNQGRSNQGSVAVQQLNKHINDGTASNGGLSSRHGTGSTALREGATSEIATNAALLERKNTIERLRNQLRSNQGSVAVQQFNKHINDRTASSGGLSSRHGTGSTLRQGATSEITTNAALQERQHTIDRLRNQVGFNQGSVAVQQFNGHLNNRIESNRGLTSRRGMGSTDLSSKNTRTSAMESSNIVTSSEHFGKPVRSNIASEMFSGRQRSRTDSVTSLGKQSVVPSIVIDHAIFTDLAKDKNPRHRNNEVAVALDINKNTNQALEYLSAEQYTSQPIVGSIFGTAENASSNTLTKKFLEKSGITREPAVDFMSTFLQHSKPTETLNRGDKSVQIVPLGPDIYNLSPNTDKITIAGSQSDAQTVDQFGVADIYTRRQQLNPSQWQQLMAKVSHEPSSRLQGINVDYQTQNVIGAGETRPLTSNINQGSSMPRAETSSEFSRTTQARNIDRSNTNRRIPLSRQSNVRSAILFEAPGMTGHKSVTIRNYVPNTLKRPSSRSTVRARVKSSSDVGQQGLQEFVGTQATAERTSSFANTFRQTQETGTAGVPILNRNAGVSINSVSLPLKDRLSVDQQIKAGQLGEAGQKIQNEMNTFKLGRSILISDGVIPEFTGPNSVHRLPIDATNLRSLTANGIRLGQPTIMSQGGSTGSNTDNSQQSTLEPFSSQTVNGQSTGVGPLNSPLTVNSREPNLGSLDAEMTNILKSRIGSLDSHIVKNSQSAKSLDSQMLNNIQKNIGSDSRILTNRQSGIGSLDSQIRSNRQSSLGSRDSQIINQLQSAMGSIDSQMTNNRQTRLGSLDSQMLNNRQSTPVHSQSEIPQRTSTGEITLQDIHGSAFAVGLGSDHHGKSLSNRLGIAIGDSTFSGGLSQGQQNIGIAVNGDLNSAMNMKSNPAQGSGSNTGNTQAIQNIGLTGANQVSTGMAAANIEQRNLDTATIIGLNQALKKQPMEATLFTSGSRFAVFGRAGDVAGKSLSSSMQAKPIPARRMGVLGPIHNCRSKPDPSSEYYFITKNGMEEHRFRCALGSAFDEMTCECSIRVADHTDCLEVHMDFNNGVVEDSSLNRLPIGNEKVEITNSTSPLAGIALFGGDGKLTIWRYQNFDFRDHIMLKVQFRPGVGGDEYQPLISNCDGGGTGPSVAIIYHSPMHEVILVLQTVNDTGKELKFKVNPNEWNDVTYIYDGQEFIGIVNGVRRYVSRENPHLLGIIGGEIKSTHAEGLIEIRNAALVIGDCPRYGHYRGAMVDIQVYTCIPKQFRLE